ncbi:MAG: helix-turn-helix transcriptional regulator [Proteobacteria bacterium]|nr:helix-turn-helix transcriptional regulator [Pseudomonadota bacterium]
MTIDGRRDLDPARLSGALQNLYAAALDPAGRRQLPDRLAAAFDAPSCLMHMRDASPARIDVVGVTENLGPLMSSYVAERYADDAWSGIATARKLDVACLGEDVVPEEKLLASDWYNDLCRPTRIHHLVGAVFRIVPGTNGLIGIHRPAGGSRFESDDRAMMQLLIPHLAQAMRMLRMADAHARTSRLAFDTLATLRVGVFVVSADNRVRLMNAAAERAAKAGSPIRVSNGRLVLADPKLDDRLRATVRKASLAPLGRSLFAGETIVVPSGEGAGVPLIVSPLPPDIADEGPAEPLAAVFIGDPASAAEPSSDLVRVTYALTPAETRLLMALLNGERLPDYADRTGISLNTAYTQLKSLFAKTGCHRQAELVRKVMSDPVLRLSGKHHDSPNG